jgi:hypothetical protein
MRRPTLRRAYIAHDQSQQAVEAPVCSCALPEGPEGGVCACGSAIPSGRERLWLEELWLLAGQLVCLQGTGHERLDAHLAKLLPEADASLTRACFLSSDRAWNEAGERFAVIASLTEPPSALGRLSRRLALRCAVEAKDERRACELFMVYEAELHKLPVEAPFLLPALEAILTGRLPSHALGSSCWQLEPRKTVSYPRSCVS